MRASRDVQVDPRGGDRTREDVERHVAAEPGAADVAAEVLAAEREVGVEAAARLADHRGRPLLPELVAVAVEEDVGLLVDLMRLEELRVGAPEDRLGSARAELAEPVEPALRVGDDEVVLRRVGAEVVVEARVVAAELRQAHRHVAVVEDDRHAEPLAQQRRDPAEVAHRNGEDDDRVDVALPFEQVDEVPAPARRHPAPDRLAHEAVGVARILLGPAQVAVALQPRGEVAHACERLALAEARVRRGPPPRRLDRSAAVRRDDQVAAGLVQPLPELPPRGRAAVAEVEVDRRRDREDLRALHRLTG